MKNVHIYIIFKLPFSKLSRRQEIVPELRRRYLTERPVEVEGTLIGAEEADWYTLELPQMVQQKFDDYESDDASVRKRPKSILLTLDRGFDTITPYFQELTLKATE